MPAPLAYFLTWSTYGSRLHGDDLGSVSRTQNHRGEPFLEPDLQRVDRESSTMSYEPILLTPPMRAVVSKAVEDHAMFRKLRLFAINPRSTHVHVVVGCGDEAPPRPEKVLQEFKSWATRRLRDAGLVRREGPVWSHHGSTRWVNDEEGLYEARNYVLNMQ